MIEELHACFNKLKRFSYPFENQLSIIPENGLYVMFEKGEKYNNLDRIVRIGTDTGENNLRKRLKEHFVIENKNRSIFRKNIGRALLNKNNHPYLKYWELDTTSKVDKEKNSKYLDYEFESILENQISNYIKSNISFTVFRVETKNQRLFWEGKLISTLAFNAQPSQNWLGNYSTKVKIRESGLWQVQGLTKDKLKAEEFEILTKLLEE